MWKLADKDFKADYKYVQEVKGKYDHNEWND